MYDKQTYYEALAAERIRELEQESAQQRRLALLPRRSLWRRMACALGGLLVLGGRRLEQFGQRDPSATYKYGA